MKALIIETAFLGDVIISLALAEELRRLDPAAEISYLVRPDAEVITNASPAVNRTIVFDKRGAESGRKGIEVKAHELDALGFDTVFLLHSSARSQALCKALHVSTKVGFEGVSHAGITHSVKDSGWENRYERAVLPATALLENVIIQTLPRLQAVELPSVNGFASQFTSVVAVAPGSVWDTKKWGDSKFLELAQRCAADGIGVLVLGGPKESEVGETIEAACGTAALSLAGKLSIIESAGALRSADLLVANDSAPVHLAVAVGTPVLTIFGPTVPEFGFAPPREAGAAIELKGLWCRPCTSHGSTECPTHTHACMNEISVESVFEMVRSKLHAYDHK